MNPTLKTLCEQIATQISTISSERKLKLDQLSAVLQQEINKNQSVNLVFVCTHNSRRSHFAQVWWETLHYYLKLNFFETFSAGTEVTRIHEHTLQTLEGHGFQLKPLDKKENPTIQVAVDEHKKMLCFSKLTNHPSIKQPYVAILTCADAEENCPYIPEAKQRFALTYNDPKKSDGTPDQERIYHERSLTIATEAFYVLFSLSSTK
jgi:protein-tyrosine-phosphatase